MAILLSGSLILCLFCHLNTIEAAPAKASDTIDFEDDWDYMVQPHSVPLLTISTKNHHLPPSYVYEEELNVESLEEEKDEHQEVTLRTEKKIKDVVRTKVSCGVCTIGLPPKVCGGQPLPTRSDDLVGIGLLRKELLARSSFETIKEKFVSLCVSFKIETRIVCNGFFDVFGPDVVPAFNNSNLGAKEACSLIFGEVCGETENELHEWDVELPDDPAPQLSDLRIPEVEVNPPILKVLHLSDTHFDPEYAIGSPANCEEPLCCRNYSTPPQNKPTSLAGRWGAYDKCDSPKALIQNMLKNIALEHPDIDYIIWTGDLPPHDIWKQTKASNLDIIKEAVKQMFDTFPDTPIFPALGNHESIPAGSFAPPWMKNENHSISWLYTTVADQWRRWLPASASNTVLHGGFYSVLLKPGFRIISLNTNYCHSINWWLLVNSTDPAKELKWLIHELTEAEDNGEKVHIIGHIPPGSADCLKVWSRNFYSIVERFQSTITAQFYGHTHADEFELFYETTEYSKPTSIAYLGPSVTTYENFNPAYRIYYVEGDHELSKREVLDHETWTMDLESANEGNNEPKWYKLYTAKDEYQMKSLKPEEWDYLIDQMSDNDHLFEKFYRNYYRDSPKRPSCDSQCKLQILCDLKSGRSQNRRHLCHDLEYSVGL